MVVDVVMASFIAVVIIIMTIIITNITVIVSDMIEYAYFANGDYCKQIVGKGLINFVDTTTNCHKTTIRSFGISITNVDLPATFVINIGDYITIITNAAIVTYIVIIATIVVIGKVITTVGLKDFIITQLD